MHAYPRLPSTPLNLATVVPFIRFGEWIMRAEPVPVELAALTTGLAEDPVATLRDWSRSIALGVLGWAIVWPVLTALCYFPLLLILRVVMPPPAKAKPTEPGPPAARTAGAAGAAGAGAVVQKLKES